MLESLTPIIVNPTLIIKDFIKIIIKLLIILETHENGIDESKN